MKSKKPIVIIIISVAIVIGLAILSICIKTKLHNQKIEMEIRVLQYNEYCKNLGMNRAVIDMTSEDFNVRDAVQNLNAQPNEEELNEIRIKVAYYNLEMGEDLTVEELMESYNAFLAEDADGAVIIERFDMAFCNGEDAEIGSEAAFRDAVNYVLGKDGTSVTFASEKQVEAAIQYVIDNPEVIELLQGEE